MTLMLFSISFLLISFILKSLKVQRKFIISIFVYFYQKWVKQFLNWQFFISFCIAWMITNGYIYVLIGLGIIFKNKYLVTIGWSILALYWMPFFCEKPITIAIALGIYKKLFKK